MELLVLILVSRGVSLPPLAQNALLGMTTEERRAGTERRAGDGHA